MLEKLGRLRLLLFPTKLMSLLEISIELPCPDPKVAAAMLDSFTERRLASIFNLPPCPETKVAALITAPSVKLKLGVVMTAALSSLFTLPWPRESTEMENNGKLLPSNKSGTLP